MKNFHQYTLDDCTAATIHSGGDELALYSPFALDKEGQLAASEMLHLETGLRLESRCY
jgi:hypothetical protein